MANGRFSAWGRFATDAGTILHLSPAWGWRSTSSPPRRLTSTSIHISPRCAKNLASQRTATTVRASITYWWTASRSAARTGRRGWTAFSSSAWGIRSFRIFRSLRDVSSAALTKLSGSSRTSGEFSRTSSRRIMRDGLRSFATRTGSSARWKPTETATSTTSSTGNTRTYRCRSSGQAHRPKRLLRDGRRVCMARRRSRTYGGGDMPRRNPSPPIQGREAAGPRRRSRSSRSVISPTQTA